MQKRKLALALTAFASASFISTAALAEQSAFGGFYGQADIGYGSTSLSSTGGAYNDGSGNNYSISTNRANSFTGTVGLGAYFPVANYWLLGVGAEYAPIAGSQANYTVSVPAETISNAGTYNMKNSYNLFISPAIAINKDSLAYAKIGFTGASFAIGTNTPNPANINSSGLSLGLGYKQIIRGGLYGFGELNYASYSTRPDGLGTGGTIKPTTTSALAGVGYKF